MNQILTFNTRLLGFNRPAPKTKMGRLVRYCERTVMLMTLMYVTLQAFPQIVFAHNLSDSHITVYSRSPLPPQTVSSIRKASSLLERSELAFPDRQERIFVCDSPWLFRFFGPAHESSFAFSVPATNNVFVTSTDIAHNKVVSSSPIFNNRTFSAIMAHEITHGRIRARLGLLKGVRLPAWVAEGYCDYVAQESSFPTDKGLQLLKSGQSDAAPAFKYFLYRQMVRHLIEDKHLSFDQIVARANDFEAVKVETMRALQAK